MKAWLRYEGNKQNGKIKTVKHKVMQECEKKIYWMPIEAILQLKV